MNMTSIHYLAGIPFSHLAAGEGHLTKGDFLTMLSDCSSVKFYDNINYYSYLGFENWKPVIEVYAKIGYIYRSLCDCNVELYSSETQLGLEDIVSEAQKIAKDLEDLTFDSKLRPELKILLRFSKDAGNLYMSQLIYRRSSSSPETLVLVKGLLEQSKTLFPLYTYSLANRSLLVLVLPLMVLGIDIAGSPTRSWYLDELHSLYNLTRKSIILEVCSVLEVVWGLNRDGKMHVDWMEICEKRESVMPLYL
jgi:hypothetical protein